MTSKLITENSANAFTPLLQQTPGATRSLHLYVTAELHRAMEIVLQQLQKSFQLRQADIFLYDRKGELYPYTKQKYAPAILQMCQLSLSQNKACYINPQQKEKNALADAIDLSAVNFATCFTPLVCAAGNIGLIYTAEPWGADSLQHSHLRQVQIVAGILKKILQDACFNHAKAPHTVYSTMSTALYLAQKDLYQSHFIRKLRKRFTSILQVSNLIHSHHDRNELIQAVLASARQVLRTQSASLFMLDRQTNEFYFELIADDNDDSQELKGKRIPAGEGIVGLCAQKKEAIIVNDVPHG